MGGLEPCRAEPSLRARARGRKPRGGAARSRARLRRICGAGPLVAPPPPQLRPLSSSPRRTDAFAPPPPPRPCRARARHLPGPGQYRTPPGVGRQTLSSKKTLPVVKFGTGTRDAITKKVGGRAAKRLVPYPPFRPKPSPAHAWPNHQSGSLRGSPANPGPQSPAPWPRPATPPTPDPHTNATPQPPTPNTQPPNPQPPKPQTFISKEHEKSCYGENTPGPITAAPYGGVGPQLLSTRHSSPKWGFGTGRVSLLLAVLWRCLARTHTAFVLPASPSRTPAQQRRAYPPGQPPPRTAADRSNRSG